MKSIHHEPILRTKLYKPLVKDHYVIRKSIIDKLEKNRLNPLTLVVAATGYGKSVTVSEWLDQTKACYCWLSLDDELNDVRTFFLFLVYAIRSVFPDALSVLYDLLQGAELPPQKVLIKFLINGLDETDQELIIVLDDYHLINNKQIHEIINDLIINPLPKLHLVIISRRDPALNLSSLHTFGDINELRMTALSFTRDEIISLAERVLNIRISEKMAASLLQKTEGWIVGLRLALMQMTENKDIEKALEELKVDRQYFRLYLLEEVLQQQPEPVRKLLLTASISDRFSRELLAAVLEEENENTVYPDTALFDQLITSNLFIIPLDEEGEWYRFHHFFHDFLSKQFEEEHSKKQIAEYHKKSSLFFEQNQLFEEAIEHALKSEDVNRVIQIFEQHKHGLLNTDQFARLEKWLQLLPTATLEKHPQLLLIRAFLQDSKADYQTMQRDLTTAELQLSDMPADSEELNQLWGEFYAITACLSFYTRNNAGALESSQKALKSLSVQSSYLRIFARAFGSLALQTLGKSGEAIATLKKDLINLHPAQSADRGRILALLSILYAFEDKLPELVDTALQYRPISLENRLFVTFIMATYFISATYYLRNELEKVHSFIDKIQDYRYAGRPFWTLNCLFTKALSLQAEGKLTELESLIQEVRAYVNDYDIQQMHGLITAFEVELALRQNNTSAAWELSKNANFEVYPPLFYFFFPQLTYIKLLMVSDEPDKIIEAENRLQQLVELGYSNHKKNLLNQTLPLQALFYQKAGNGKKAMEIMNKALTLAKPTGHIRNFLDLGSEMQTMIKTLYRKKPDDAYLAKIDKAFKEEEINLSEMSPQRSATSPIFPATEIERFTNREINLLQLVAEGYQNKEIAEKLYVAPDSIKKSLYRLYQKLKVKNRTSAVSKAVKMDLIKTSSERD